MTYSLSLESHDRFLIAHIQADDISPEIGLAYTAELHEECVRTGHSHLLIIRDIPTVLSLGGYFNAAESSIEILRGIKTAWINPYAALERDLEFFCLACNNRGSQYKVFSDRPRAEKWLGDEISKPTPLRSFSRQYSLHV